ncbi:MAG: hypothetical protein J1E62_01110 [Lachnospiraceae bacterium]|nr:hypothetical protein [Lachnospiraceae bacterium]
MTQQPQWQNHEGFRAMEPKKQEMVLLLTKNLQGKNINNALPVLLEWKQTMERENIRFTPEENQLLTEIFMANMTPEGRKQFEMLKPFLKQYRHF